MWTFPVITALCFLSVFPSAWIVRGISQGFWARSVTHEHILIAQQTKPEIETLVYVAMLVVSVCLFFFLFQFANHVRYHRLFSKSVLFINYSFALYLLLVPRVTLFTVDQIRLPLFGVCALLAIFCSRIKKISGYVLEAMIGMALIRYLAFPIIQLDLGNRIIYSIDGYLRYAVPLMLLPLAASVFILASRRIPFLAAFFDWFSIKKISIVLLGCIVVSLAYLMTKSQFPSDTFFTLLPAYHALHGGTLLVSVMSQYGLLYLAPWIFWLAIFPNAPVSFPVGTFVTMLLLFFYFIVYFKVAHTLIRRRLLFVVTVVASYYYTILVRYTPVSDMISLVSTPAFTPLRFGIFIIPLWFLIQLNKTGNRLYMKYFIISSAILFFYSFEIGMGLVASMGMSILLYGLTQPNRKSVVLGGVKMFLATFVSALLLLCLYTLVFARTLPNFSMYWYLATLYGSGFLTTPIKGKLILFVPLSIAIIALLIGLTQVFRKKEMHGLVLCYLAFIQLVELPYYTGRSMHQTIYSISLPFLLLSGMLIERGISILQTQRRSFAIWSLVCVCVSVSFTGFARGSVILLNTASNIVRISYDVRNYTWSAFSKWKIRSTTQYAFLSKHLPTGCPLLSFDEKEFELFPALGVPPAFQYAFVYGFITSKEQVDSLVPHKGSREICIFVSDRFLKQKDDFSYGMYTYFMRKYSKHMRRIAVDATKGYELYTLPSSVVK